MVNQESMSARGPANPQGWSEVLLDNFLDFEKGAEITHLKKSSIRYRGVICTFFCWANKQSEKTGPDGDAS